MSKSARFLFLADIALRGLVRTDLKLRERRKDLNVFRKRVKSRQEELMKNAQAWRESQNLKRGN